jgi:hypothetical protein
VDSQGRRHSASLHPSSQAAQPTESGSQSGEHVVCMASASSLSAWMWPAGFAFVSSLSTQRRRVLGSTLTGVDHMVWGLNLLNAATHTMLT